MEEEIYHLNTESSKTYFNIADGVVSVQGRKTNVSPDKLSEFLAIAKELGFKTGKL